MIHEAGGNDCTIPNPAGAYQVSEYIDWKLVHEVVKSHPSLVGIAVRGWLKSENGREVLIFAPVTEP